MRPSTIKHDACAHAVTAPPYPRLDALAQKTLVNNKNKMRQKKDGELRWPNQRPSQPSRD
jgi:hypothetical protein